ncbi:SDR family NAD(P)-dependent oxidoreductase [Actinoplanes sp. HUAS TT8]|uniref:SDR family NAD(P)-dependent oxidoreductase n=1 Tax=Actinoplanes sp. HUAS TT8 TaxID=3447453 RepID=UPI003F527E25
MTRRGVILVTGAAGDIGQSVCRQAAERGLLVMGLDLRPCPDGLPVTGWQVADLSDGDAPDSLGEWAAGPGPLRYVVHVVGGSEVAELREPDLARIPMDVIRRTVGLNLFSAYAVLRATIQQVRQAEGDRGYTVVSSANALGGYGAPGYSSAKAGLHGLVAAMTVPLGRDGIRINAVAPGTTRTANFTRIADELGRDPNYDRIGELGLPRGQVLEASEVATAILSLALDNPAVSGTVVKADAGQTIMRPQTRP